VIGTAGHSLEPYRVRRYFLTLSTFAGLVPWASHWWCRLRWVDEADERHEADAERKDGDYETGQFPTKKAARAAGLRLAKKLSKDVSFYLVTEGDWAECSPQPCLTAPGNLKARLNKLWRSFDKLDGYACPRPVLPAVTAIDNAWNALMTAVAIGPASQEARPTRSRAARRGR
jgi:hypothetical protein